MERVVERETVVRTFCAPSRSFLLNSAVPSREYPFPHSGLSSMHRSASLTAADSFPTDA